MATSFTGKDGEPLAIQINITRSFVEGSGTTWVTSVPQHATLAEINEISDKMMAAIQRQELHTRIAGIQNDIEMHAKQKAQVVYGVKSLEKKHGDFSKANMDTKNQYNQSVEGLVRIDTLIETLRDEQDRLKEMLN